MEGVVKILSLLPLRALYALSDGLIYPIMFYVIRYRRQLSYRNIRASFPDKTDKEIRAIQKAFYHHLADVIVEIIHSYRATDEQMREHISFFGTEEVERLAAAHHGVIFMLGHMGNWEYTADIHKRYTLPHLQHYNVYRHQSNRSANQLMIHLREKRSGEGSGIEKHMLLRSLIRVHQAGHPFTLGLIADQKPTPGNDYYWTDFLHHDTGFLGGGEVIARKFGYAVVYARILSPSRGKYELYFDTITDDPAHTEPYWITEQFARRLEANIQEQPEMWLWTHNRWKWEREENRGIGESGNRVKK